MQCPFSIRHEVLPDVNSQLRGKDQTNALNIPFTLTQWDLLQEALAVTFAKDQTQTLNIPVKVPIGGGRYAELTEWNGKTQGHSSLRRMQCPYSIRHEVLPDVNSQLRGFDDDVDVFSQVISPVHGFSYLYLKTESQN
jgi:hypothetical protein